jgi:CRISPR-associated protein Cas2
MRRTTQDVLVCYDINTTTKEGERRLRAICRSCKNFGQRVQYSVYAVRVTPAQLEGLIEGLRGIIDEAQDSLHLYVLPGGRDACLQSYGKSEYVDFDAPLIL